MTSPLVTVGIPTLNRAGYLRDAIASVRAQTHQHLEIIVGNNASTDDTGDVIRDAHSVDPRVRSITHATNIGMVSNWNAILAMASGPLAVMLSDDDLMLPTAIERLLEPLVDPSVVFSYCRVLYLNADDSIRGVGRRAPVREGGDAFIRASLRGEREVWPSAMLYRRDAATSSTYANIGTAADLLHRLSLATRGDVAWVDEPVVRYRVHSGSLSSRNEVVRDSFRHFLAAVLSDPALMHHVPEARRHVARLMRASARAHALRGDLLEAQQVLAESAEYEPASLLAKWDLRLMYSPIGRLAWRVRRRVRSMLGERRADQSE